MNKTHRFWTTLRLLALLLAVAASASSRLAQAQFITNSVPVFSYAIFYEDLLEFSTAATMTINGRVHSNTKIYTGSDSTLTFNDVVTTCGSLTSPINNGAGPWTFPGGIFNGNPPYLTNVDYVRLFVFPSTPHMLIERSPTNDSLTGLGQQRMANQAAVVLLVSNVTVRAVIQASPGTGLVAGADSSPALIISATNTLALATNLPFLTITNRFLDQRENKTVLSTDINVARYAQWLQTNAQVQAKYSSAGNLYPTILYVIDYRTVTTTQMVGIRLTNGIAPPRNGGLGFTVATADPLYVLGNYNQTNAAFLATTNTSAGTVPCALMSDSLTVLSGSWRDAVSFTQSSTGPDASTLTVNAAIITGNVPSTGTTASTFSGGIHNLPRLLEDWAGGSSSLWLNTSLVCLYSSQIATNKFITPGTGSYYTAPTRHFSFDRNFLNPVSIPPGTPTYSQVINPVVIVTQPTNAVVVAGGTASFSVNVSNYYYLDGLPLLPVRYAWYFNGQALGSAATNATYTINNVQATNVGSYYAVASAATPLSYGVVTSSVVSLTIVAPPQITGLSETSSRVPVGSNVTIQVTATGTSPIYYQWYFGPPPGDTILTGATNTLLTLSNLQTNQSGYYSCFVSNFVGHVWGFIIMQVTSPPPAIQAVMQIDTVSAPAGSIASVPVQLLALGNESAVGFSLAYDTNLLSIGSTTNVVLGAGATTASLLANTNQASGGRLGILVSQPSGSIFAVGTQEVARVYFSVSTNVFGTNLTVVSFADQPVHRGLSDVSANDLPATYVSGGVVVGSTNVIGPATASLQVGAVSAAAPGDVIGVPMQLVALGGEAGIGFSLTFDTNLLFIGSSTNAVLGAGASGASMVVNTNQVNAGHLGVVLSLSAGSGFAAGTSEVARVYFKTSAAARGTNQTPITFSDHPVARDLSDVSANSLPIVYVDGGVVILGSDPSLRAVLQNWALGAVSNRMSFAGAAGRTYIVQLSTNLTSWVNAATNTADFNGNWSVSDSPPTNGVHFYRSVVP